MCKGPEERVLAVLEVVCLDRSKWEGRRGERQAGNRFCRTLWAGVKSQDFILRAM